MATEACQHHWLIEPAHTQESRAQCTNCGATRTFSNAPASRFDHDGGNARMDRGFRSAARSTHRERIELSDEVA